MTRKEQLITLHSFLCERTTSEEKLCGGSFKVFNSLGMGELQIFQINDLFSELKYMGLITEYNHILGFSDQVPALWSCKVIGREFPHTNTKEQ